MDQSLEKHAERFGIKPKPQRSPYDHIGLFLLDLSDLLILPGANEVVFFSLQSDIECDPDVVGQLEEIIRTRGYRDRLKLLEYSRATSEGLQILGEIPGLAAFSRSELGQLKKTTPLKGFLTNLLVQKFPLAAFNPYTYQGPVTGTRFFGREDALKTLRLQTGKSFVLSGVRRSGKTSLMMELIRRIQLDQETQEISVFVNFETCQKFSDIPYLVLRRLAEVLPSTSPALVERSKDLIRLASSHQWKQPDHLSHLETTLWSVVSSIEGHRIRFLFDEYDRVTALEIPHDRIFTRVCRDLVMRAKTAAKGKTSSGFLQFVFAGSRKLYEEILSGSSPFFNIGAERLPLQNFDVATLTTLVAQPLRELGVEVHDADSMAQALLERTGGHPATTQHLLSLVFTDQQVEKARAVGKEDVGRAAGQLEFLGLLANTLEMNVSPIGRFILAQLAVNHREKVNTKFIHGVGQRHFIRFDENVLNVELQDLADSGYLRALEFSAGQSNYKLAVPVVQELFTSEDIQLLVQELQAKKLCTPLPRS